MVRRRRVFVKENISNIPICIREKKNKTKKENRIRVTPV